MVLTDPDTILQTIYDDDRTPLQAIAIDEASGKIATCASTSVRVYRPYGHGEDALKVRELGCSGNWVDCWLIEVVVSTTQLHNK